EWTFVVSFYARITCLVACCLLTIATSASAECAWPHMAYVPRHGIAFPQRVQINVGIRLSAPGDSKTLSSALSIWDLVYDWPKLWRMSLRRQVWQRNWPLYSTRRSLPASRRTRSSALYLTVRASSPDARG